MPTCHGSLRKVFNAVGVVFKGSGFYRTDSRPKEGASSGSLSSSNGESKSEAKKESTNGGGDKSPPTGFRLLGLVRLGEKGSRQGGLDLVHRVVVHSSPLWTTGTSGCNVVITEVCAPAPPTVPPLVLSRRRGSWLRQLARAASWHRRKLAVLAAVATVLTGPGRGRAARAADGRRGRAPPPRWPVASC